MHFKSQDAILLLSKNILNASKKKRSWAKIIVRQKSHFRRGSYHPLVSDHGGWSFFFFFIEKSRVLQDYLFNEPFNVTEILCMYFIKYNGDEKYTPTLSAKTNQQNIERKKEEKTLI